MYEYRTSSAESPVHATGRSGDSTNGTERTWPAEPGLPSVGARLARTRSGTGSRSRVAALTALALVGSLAACAPVGPGGTTNPEQELTGDWVLQSGSDAQGEFDLSETSITLTVADPEHTGGRTPCNSYGATVTGSGDTVKIEGGAMTEVACADQYLMELEGRYIGALGTIDRADRDGEKLLLTGPSVELAFSLYSAPPVANIRETLWALVELVGGDSPDSSVSNPPVPAGMIFEERLEGSTGCRDFTADYTLDGAILTISNLVGDEVEFCDADETAQEQHVLAVLDGTVQVESTDGRLSLFNELTGLGLAYRAIVE